MLKPKLNLKLQAYAPEDKRRIDCPKSTQRFVRTVEDHGSWCGNDPSAGSPTETLLRLHLPLDDKV